MAVVGSPAKTANTGGFISTKNGTELSLAEKMRFGNKNSAAINAVHFLSRFDHALMKSAQIARGGAIFPDLLGGKSDRERSSAITANHLTRHIDPFRV